VKILLTGGAGFIGTHLKFNLETNGHVVRVFDKAYHSSYDLLTSEGVQGFEDVLAEGDFDVVVHLAAQVGRVFGEDDFDHTIRSNCVMTANVLETLTTERFVYVSTSEIYGDLGSLYAREDAITPKALPHNLYGLTKRHGEEISALYVPEGGLQIVRPSMPYGPGLPHGRGRAAIINMLWQADTGQEIPVHKGAERSWCWVGDLVNGFRYVIEKGEIAECAGDYEDGFGCYNLGRDDASISMLEVARKACEITGGSEDLIRMVNAPQRQTVVKRLSTQKVENLGWRPSVDLDEGMQMTFDAIKGEWQ